MADRAVIASFSNSETQTVTIDETDGISEDVRAVKLTLRKPKTDKGVKWSTDTVDNEHMNKKKSKCCCIYEKPRVFGESSSESDDECDNCFGHVELKYKKQKPSPPEESPESKLPLNSQFPSEPVPPSDSNSEVPPES